MPWADEDEVKTSDLNLGSRCLSFAEKCETILNSVFKVQSSIVLQDLTDLKFIDLVRM